MTVADQALAIGGFQRIVRSDFAGHQIAISKNDRWNFMLP
jgi:hypothetical protein